MKVADILRGKSIIGVETIAEQETLSGLSRTLCEKRIGAVVVTRADGGVAGVISERDVVRALGENGARVLTDRVSRHMTREVQTTEPDEDVNSVLERMSAGRFRHMPVIDQGELIGVVSIGDLVQARIGALQAENAAMEAFIQS